MNVLRFWAGLTPQAVLTPTADLARQRAGAPGGEARRHEAQLPRKFGIAAQRGREHGQYQNDAFRNGRIIGRNVEHEQDVDDAHQNIGAEH